MIGWTECNIALLAARLTWLLLTYPTMFVYHLTFDFSGYLARIDKITESD